MPGEQGLARVSTHSPLEILTVSALARSVRDLLEHRYPLLWVAGEISNFTVAKSGHAYFVLKDEHAQVRCVMFRQRQQNLEWTPRDGMQIEVQALVSLYEPRGDFQLNVETMRRAGLGALFEAFLKLRDKLEKEGLFKAETKRALPSLPRAIGVITSRDAAALRDVLTTLARRNPSIEVVVFPVHFQADGKPRPAWPPGTRETHAARRSPYAQAGSPRRAAAGSERTARPIAVETRASCRPNLVRAALGGRSAFAPGPGKAPQYRQASGDLAAVGRAAACCNACNARTRGLGLRPSDRQSVAPGSCGSAGARLQRRAGRLGPDRAAGRESCCRRLPRYHVCGGRRPSTRRALSLGNRDRRSSCLQSGSLGQKIRGAHGCGPD